MIEDKIQVFIDGVERFFNEFNDMSIDIGAPYLIENNNPKARDFTGIIGISGEYKGCVYFTAPRIMLNHILMMYGGSVGDTNKESMLDLVGEIANTVSGNARSKYGKNFIISVPLVLEGAPSDIYLPKELRSYVIPITWNKYKADVVICLQK